MNYKNIILGSLLPIFFVGAIIYAKNEGEIERREAEAARSVDVLPVGVEEKWLRYVDDRLNYLIRINGTQIQISNALFSWQNEFLIVSSNMPYAIECNSITGGAVIFGFGDNAISVSVYGLLANMDRDSPQAPELGVVKSSVAAKNLYLKSCDQIAEYMSELIQLYD